MLVAPPEFSPQAHLNLCHACDAGVRCAVKSSLRHACDAGVRCACGENSGGEPMMVKCCLLLWYYAFDYACIGEPMMVKFCLSL